VVAAVRLCLLRRSPTSMLPPREERCTQLAPSKIAFRGFAEGAACAAESRRRASEKARSSIQGPGTMRRAFLSEGAMK
jgi:hypothetical protein